MSNVKKFMENIKLDVNGNIKAVIVDSNGIVVKGDTQYNTFKNISLTPEGYLKITLK